MSEVQPVHLGLSAQISLAVAKTAQEAVKSQGQAVVGLIQDAAELQQQSLGHPKNPQRGRLIDLLG